MPLNSHTNATRGRGGPKRPLVMAKFTVHMKPETLEELTDELPDGEPWGQYILECIELRKRIEGRDLVLTEPDTRPVDERE